MKLQQQDGDFRLHIDGNAMVFKRFSARLERNKQF
jgi:hypothetical protein